MHKIGPNYDGTSDVMTGEAKRRRRIREHIYIRIMVFDITPWCFDSTHGLA